MPKQEKEKGISPINKVFTLRSPFSVGPASERSTPIRVAWLCSPAKSPSQRDRRGLTMPDHHRFWVIRF